MFEIKSLLIKILSLKKYSFRSRESKENGGINVSEKISGGVTMNSTGGTYK